jgi:hypothetical protein
MTYEQFLARLRETPRDDLILAAQLAVCLVFFIVFVARAIATW